MSKQLTVSATIAVLSMALFAMATTLGKGPVAVADAGNAPLVELNAAH